MLKCVSSMLSLLHHHHCRMILCLLPSNNTVAMIQNHEGVTNHMNERILVTYASEFGSTAAVAEAIGDALRTAGSIVDVQPVLGVSNINIYKALIIGSAIYNGTWLPEAVHFVEFHAAELKRIPVAYFAVCATVRNNTPENRHAAHTFFDQVLTKVPQIQPVDLGVFAGQIDTTKLSPLVRLRMLLTTKLRHGDYRDWDAIRAWATALRPALIRSAT